MSFIHQGFSIWTGEKELSFYDTLGIPEIYTNLKGK